MFYTFFEAFRSVFAAHKWSERMICHGTTQCCQYVDWPNDNNPNRPPDWELLKAWWRR